MRADDLAYLRCPCCRGRLEQRPGALACTACGASYAIEAGIPRLLPRGDEAQRRRQVAALDREMRRHWWVTAKMSLAALTWIPAQRVRLLRDLSIGAGAAVLDHCTGTGANLPALAAAVGRSGRLVAMDLSAHGVERARDRCRRRSIAAAVHQGDALALPYADGAFDAVVHYGALNQLGPGLQTAIDEVVRVTRAGGLVVLLDEGLEESRRGGWWGRLMVWGNPLFAARPPLHLLPERSAPEVRWVVRGMFYEVRFHKPG